MGTMLSSLESRGCVNPSRPFMEETREMTKLSPLYCVCKKEQSVQIMEMAFDGIRIRQ